MALPHTTPTVITDRNGKVTTVHRKMESAKPSSSGIPSVVLNSESDSIRSTKSVQQEMWELPATLQRRAVTEFSDGKQSAALLDCTKNAASNWEVDTLRLLEKHVHDGRNADSLVEAIMLLRERYEDPEAYLTDRHAEAVFHIRDALEHWEMRYDNYKGGDIDRRSEGREAFILYVLEDPTRDSLVEQTLSRGIGTLSEVIELEEEFRAVHVSVVDGVL